MPARLKARCAQGAPAQTKVATLAAGMLCSKLWPADVTVKRRSAVAEFTTTSAIEWSSEFWNATLSIPSRPLVESMRRAPGRNGGAACARLRGARAAWGTLAALVSARWAP